MVLGVLGLVLDQLLPEGLQGLGPAVRRRQRCAGCGGIRLLGELELALHDEQPVLLVPQALVALVQLLLQPLQDGQVALQLLGQLPHVRPAVFFERLFDLLEPLAASSPARPAGSRWCRRRWDSRILRFWSMTKVAMELTTWKTLRGSESS